MQLHGFFSKKYKKFRGLHNQVTAATEKSIQYRTSTYKFMYRIFIYLFLVYVSYIFIDHRICIVIYDIRDFLISYTLL